MRETESKGEDSLFGVRCFRGKPVERVDLFGFAARGAMTPQSDVDIVCAHRGMMAFTPIVVVVIVVGLLAVLLVKKRFALRKEERHWKKERKQADAFAYSQRSRGIKLCANRQGQISIFNSRLSSSSSSQYTFSVQCSRFGVRRGAVFECLGSDRHSQRLRRLRRPKTAFLTRQFGK